MIVIGKYKELYPNSDLPSIKELVQKQPTPYKDKILQYLKRGKKGAVAAGGVIDIITGEKINLELCCYSDGEYGWRSDTIYYFEKYNLKLEEEFVDHVLGRKKDEKRGENGLIKVVGGA